jgi:hypothetical protein
MVCPLRTRSQPGKQVVNRVPVRFSAWMICLMLSVSGHSSHSVTCADLLVRLKSYSQEVWHSGGLRIFLKSAPLREEHYGGFAAPAKQGPSLVWIFAEAPLKLVGINNWRLTPWHGLYHQLIQRPVVGMSKAVGLGAREPTIALLILLSLGMWEGIDTVSSAGYEWKVEQEIASHLADYERFIHYDFRFHQIKEGVQSKRLTQKEALTEAYCIGLKWR